MGRFNENRFITSDTSLQRQQGVTSSTVKDLLIVRFYWVISSFIWHQTDTSQLPGGV